MPFHGGQMDDKSIASDCLASQKFLASCYNHAITESANDALRRDFMAIYQEEQNNLKSVFDFMARQGWYQVNYAHSQDINQVHQQLQQAQQQAGQQVNLQAPPQGMQFGLGQAPGMALGPTPQGQQGAMGGTMPQPPFGGGMMQFGGQGTVNPYGVQPWQTGFGGGTGNLQPGQPQFRG